MEYFHLIFFAVFALVAGSFLFGRLKYGSWTGAFLKGSIELFLRVNEQGFRLSILFPFRFLSPPMFIPWEQVEAVEEERMYFSTYHVVRFRDHWARLSVSGEPGHLLYQKFLAHRVSRA